ncbi:ABC transporter ATP-binding protein [bacterium]|nr:ABC transporter ATP-binding protein [bacterium]
MALLPSSGRRQLGLFLLGSCLAGILDVLGVGSVMPFMALVSSPDGHLTQALLRKTAWAGWSVRELMVGLASLLLVALALVHLLQVGLVYLACRFAREQQRVLSARVYHTYLNSDYEWILKYPGSHLQESLQRARSLGDCFYRPLVGLCVHGLAGVMIFCLLAWVDWKVTLAVAVMLGIMVAVMYWRCRGLLQELSLRHDSMNEALKASVGDVLYSWKSLYLAGAQRRLVDAHEKEVDRLGELHSRRILLHELPRLFIHSASQAAILALIIYLELNLATPEELIPRVSLFALATYRLIPSLQACLGCTLTLRESWPQMQRLRADLGRSTQPEPGPLHSGPTMQSHFSVGPVSYAYPGAQVESISECFLEIRPGERVALVGRTASGKSTLLNLWLGLLASDRSLLKLDGKPLQGERLRQFQRCLGYVPQDNLLANQDLASNIAFCGDHPHYDLEQIKRVAKVTGIHAFVDFLPDGFRSNLGERGTALSGGQRQRVSIARALYRESQILILDEATNALDAHSERELFGRLRSYLGDSRSLIVVAHRLDSVRDFDRLYLIHEGRVVDSGTYKELQKRSPLFASLLQEEPL